MRLIQVQELEVSEEEGKAEALAMPAVSLKEVIILFAISDVQVVSYSTNTLATPAWCSILTKKMSRISIP